MRTISRVTVAAILAITGCSKSASAPAAGGQRASGSVQQSAGTPGARSPEPGARKYLLEQVDDAAVVQIYADGFSALPLQQKTLIWHLYQAALAGRDIFVDQKHHLALEMRGVIDQVVAHPQGVDAATLADVQR